MIATLEWLREYCEIDLPASTLGEILTVVGLEVESLEERGDDALFEFEVTPNRPDLLSIIGIAREIAAALRTELKLPSLSIEERGESVESLAKVVVEDTELCPRYIARVIRGVTVRESPWWLRRRLEAVGLNPINNVVDITNYVLFEYGQPLHAFDLDTLSESTIVVRRAKPGERIELIDGQVVELNSEHLVIADSSKPVALAGVMGGKETEISPRTRNLLIESAYFKPSNIRRSSKSLAIRTESSYRFERGVDPLGVELASRRATALISDICGGTVAEGSIDILHLDLSPRKVSLRPERVERVLGLRLGVEEIADALSRIGMTVEESGQILVATVPAFRVDIKEEIDLIEEIARLYGYDRVPVKTTMCVATSVPSAFERVERRTKEVLVGLNFAEVVTTSFLNPTLASSIAPWSKGEPLILRNPLRKEEGAMRMSLIPGLLVVRKTNQDLGVRDVNIFELARVYLPRGPEGREERHTLGLLSDGDFYALKGVVEALFERLGLERSRFEHCLVGWLVEGSSASIKRDQEVIGYIGVLARSLQDQAELKNPVTVAELLFDRLVEVSRLERGVKIPLRFPPIERDLDILLDNGVSWAELQKCVRDSGGDLLREILFIDLYRGEQIPPEKKSITFRLIFQHPERTLVSEEVDRSIERVLTAVESELGGKLRAL